MTMSTNIARRRFLQAAGLAVTITGRKSLVRGMTGLQESGRPDVVEIKISNNYRIGRWSFDPVGVYLQPGQRVRWICQKWGGSATAFHPENGNHELRIPEAARPFDSDILIDKGLPGSSFEWVFEEEGTYDIFSRNHERLGAVGRIVVGSPGGPAEKPPGYGAREGRAPMFPAPRKMFAWLSSERIVRDKIVAYPPDLLERRFPMQENDF